MSNINKIIMDDMNYSLISSITKLNKDGNIYNLGLNTNDANLTPEIILEGSIGYSKGKKITGTMLNRNIVGKNSAIGVSQKYPSTSLNIGLYPQYTIALDNNEYFCICVPKGYYNGNTYVGVLKSAIPK